MLNNGNTQREISSEVWVSITTVTRGNKILKNNKKLIDKYL
jgi:Trp operon repressor